MKTDSLLKYRPEIDGLRALAVVPVILFHAGFNIFSGGFVGVDIFFVISGYLITSILLGELDAGHFSLLNFYERRARRILPALFFVMVVCLPFAWLWMFPHDLKDFGASVAAVASFTSNILFWRQSGYFELDASLKPLLHTWSLAVEEQYYIFFPLFLMFCWKLGKRNLATLVAVMAVGSLALAQWASHHMPTAAYYLLPTRGWEIFLGALAAFSFNHFGGVYPGKSHQNIFSLSGLILICVSLFLFDEHTPFPGVYALVPTVGALLVILFAHEGTYAQRLLSQKPLVAIGLISYSAYLWHQPLLAFTKRVSTEPSKFLLACLCVAVLPLAYFSWAYIEMPFRQKKQFDRKFVFSAAASAMCVFLALGVVIFQQKGFETYFVAHRLDDSERVTYERIQKSTDYDFTTSMFDDGKCRFWSETATRDFTRRFEGCASGGKKAVVVVGDSHGMNLFNILAKANVSDFTVAVAEAGCRPQDNKPYCEYEGLRKFVAQHKDAIAYVVYHQSGSYFIGDSTGLLNSSHAFEGHGYKIDTDDVHKAYDYMRSLAAIVPVVWLGPFAEARVSFSDLVFRDKPVQVNENSLLVFRDLEKYLASLMASENNVASLRYISFTDFYKIGKDFLVSGDCITYRDKDHLSTCGEDIIAGSFQNFPVSAANYP